MVDNYAPPPFKEGVAYFFEHLWSGCRNATNHVQSVTLSVPSICSRSVGQFLVIFIFSFVACGSIGTSQTYLVSISTFGTAKALLSPRNRVGGDIVMRLFVCGWVSDRVRPSVALYLMDTIATKVFVKSLSNFTCKLWMMRGGTLLILGHGVKDQGQPCHCIRPCGHNTDYSFCPITFKLHM